MLVLAVPKGELPSSMFLCGVPRLELLHLFHPTQLLHASNLQVIRPCVTRHSAHSGKSALVPSDACYDACVTHSASVESSAMVLLLVLLQALQELCGVHAVVII